MNTLDTKSVGVTVALLGIGFCVGVLLGFVLGIRYVTGLVK